MILKVFFKEQLTHALNFIVINFAYLSIITLTIESKPKILNFTRLRCPPRRIVSVCMSLKTHFLFPSVTSLLLSFFMWRRARVYQLSTIMTFLPRPFSLHFHFPNTKNYCFFCLKRRFN